MSKSGMHRTAYTRPVERLQLPEINSKARIILIVVLLAVAGTAVIVGVTSLLSGDSGWREVEVTTTQLNCSSDFIFNYQFGEAGISAAAESKAVTQLYSDAAVSAYDVFSTSGSDTGSGLAYVNANINRIIEVDPALYRAFEQVQEHGNRCLYLAPVYVEYNRMFICEDEGEAARYDPVRDKELAEYILLLASYGREPDMIDVELCGDNTVCLRVSDAYLEFAAEYGIETFLDFGWLKNAFVADYIADILTENGYTNGYLASYDGFTRNLDDSGRSYSLNLFDRLGDSVYLPAVMQYSGATGIVSLRNYPLNDADRWHYFSFSDGRIATAFISPQSGMDSSSTDNLVVYGQNFGCAELLLSAADIFLADELDEHALFALSERQIGAVWFEDTLLRCTRKDLDLTLTEDAVTAGYRIP